MDYSLLGKSSIPGASAVGKDVRYEDRFGTLQGEIDKLSHPKMRDTFQWETVAKTAALILNDQSKDLLVASYMAVALVNLQGVAGLDMATQMYKDLLNEYWEDMFPPIKRLRGRIAAVEWWVDRTAQALDAAKPCAVSEALRDTINERFEAIDALLKKHLGDAVLLRPVIRAAETFFARNVQVETPTQQVAKENAASVASAAPAVATPAVAASSEGGDFSVPNVSLESAEQVHKQLRPVFQKIAQGAKLLREASVMDPQSYHWLRFAAYSWIKASPPATGADGQTNIPAPPPQIISRLKSLHQTGSWAELLHASETALMNTQHVFWLDLNWYTTVSLKNMNGCDAARESVGQGVLHLLNRLEGLEQLCFSDKKPFANEETREWIQELREASSSGGSAGNASSIVADPLDETLEEAIREARNIAEDARKIGVALRVLEKRINSCASEKDVLELRLVMLELISNAKQFEPAAALAELVLNDVERFHLREWDVPLAVRCHLQVYDVLKKATGSGYKERLREVYQRILSMSAADALSL